MTDRLFSSLLLLFLFLICIVIFDSSTGDSSTLNWDNIANITGMTDITNVEYNSNDDTLIITTKNSYYIWGIENQTLIFFKHVPSLGGFIDSDWNDDLELVAWVHEGSVYPTWDF